MGWLGEGRWAWVGWVRGGGHVGWGRGVSWSVASK